MLTFEQFSEDKSDDKVLELIRKGLNLQRGSDFWDDLLYLCGNAEAMANLLDVPKEKITGLAGKINKLKTQVGSVDKTSKKDKLLVTGDK